MGWTFGYETLNEVKHSINGGRGNLTVLGQKATAGGRHLWTAYETKDGTKFINLDLIAKQDGDWGYKDLDEGSEPFYYDCPLALLKLVGETTDEGALRWRAIVRERARVKKEGLKVGQVIEVAGRQYEITGKNGRNYTAVNVGGINIYKVTPKVVAVCKIVK